MSTQDARLNVRFNGNPTGEVGQISWRRLTDLLEKSECRPSERIAELYVKDDLIQYVVVRK